MITDMKEIKSYNTLPITIGLTEVGMKNKT